MKKILVCVLLLALLGTSSLSPAAAQEETGTIRFAIYTDTARDKVAQAQADLYMQEHPDVTVEIVSVPYANYYTQLGQGIAAGDAWDVFMINGAYFASLGKTGALLDLTDEIAQRGFDVNQYVVDPMNSTYQGRQYVLPYELNTCAMFYNKDLFDAAGVAYPKEGWTWDDFRNTAIQLTDASKDQFGCYLRLAQPDLASFIHQAGGSLYNEDFTQIDFSSPEVVEALTYMTDMVTKYGCCPSPSQLPANIAPFMTGKIAMASGMCFEVISTMAAEFNWGIAPWPQYKKAGGDFWTQGMAIYSGTKNQALALEYLFFLASEDAQTIMAKQLGATPSMISVAMSDAYINENTPDGMKYLINEYAQGRAVAEPFTAKWAAISGAGTSVVQSELTLVRLGQESLEDAIVKMNQEAQALLDELK